MSLFTKSDLITALAEARKLENGDEDEAKPYEHKYKAAEVLQAAMEKAEEALRDCAEPERQRLEEAAAILRCNRGLALSETDLAAEARREVTASLAVLERRPVHTNLMVMALNFLGLDANDRGEPEKALELLKRADALYQDRALQPAKDRQIDEEGSREEPVTGQASSEKTKDGDGGELAIVAAELERLHTSTLFYLAQVYGNLGDQGQSGICCAATLRNQLGFEPLDARLWVINAVKLTDYYTERGDFALSHHLLAAASAVAAKSQDQGAGGGVDEEAAAKVEQAWGKLAARRLKVSAERRAEADRKSPAEPSTGALPDCMRFEGLDLPDEKTLPWGETALVADFEGAKALHNQAMGRFKAALSYYVLDGHVIDHVQTLLLVNELISSLAEFAPSEHEKCVLHKSRAKRLGPLLSQLNPSAYPDLYLALQVAVAGAHREIMDIKFDADRPFPKVAAAAQEAKVHYDAMLAPYRDASGRFPQKFDEGMEEVLLNQVFYLARVNSRLHPPLASGQLGDTDHLAEAVELYTYCRDYVRRNKVEGLAGLAELCGEMAQLLTENVELLRAKARRRGA